MFLPVEKLTVIRGTIEKMTPVARNLLGDGYVWNMDDLFPLFLYVVVRARIPHLGAELEFMEHFMDRNLDNGELGIMFTTLKVGLNRFFDFSNLPGFFPGLLPPDTPSGQVISMSSVIVFFFVFKDFTKSYLTFV